MPGHRHEDQADFLSFAENPDADEGKNLQKWGTGDIPGHRGGRNAFLTSPKNSWYGEVMTPARKAIIAREWIIFALSFGLGGHIALGLVLHNPSRAMWPPSPKLRAKMIGGCNKERSSYGFITEAQREGRGVLRPAGHGAD